MNPYELPVYTHKERILSALKDNQVIVVESPTGSGKTTQLPLILHEAGYSSRGVIGVTQPRRIAALSVSDYIARQTDTKVPGLVGYKMRFEDKTNLSTRIKIMTDGILLQEIKGDYTLSNYSVIVVDEAHERSLNIDFILGLLKRVLEMRSDFKVIISSATINAEVFSNYFNECPVVRIETQMYPVSMIYDTPDKELGDEALITKVTDIVDRIVDEKRKGDILIFLSGEKHIKDCLASLYAQPYHKKLWILPLYSRLSKEEQEQVFIPTPPGKIKIIVATNIAETSVTIDGITSVIDSGLAKLNYYNPRTYTSSLVEGPISKASCNQRKGRAGRTRPGTCYRLYSKDDFEARPLYTTEEIFRTDLSEVVLRMAEIGITEFESFDFISPPGKPGIHGAVETLFLLEALSEDRTLSSVGKMMVDFPLIPRHSRMIVEALRKYPDVIEETLIAAGFLTGNSPFLLPQGEEIAARKAHHTFRDPAGDFISYLKIFRAYETAEKKDKFCERFYLDTRIMGEIKNVKEQLALIVSDMGIPIGSGGPVSEYLSAVSRGLIQFVCVRSGRGEYRSLTAERIMIHPGSVMFRETPRYIVAGEVVRTSRTYARSVSPLESNWLKAISPALWEGFDKAAPAARGGEKGTRREIEKAGGKEKAGKKDTTWQITLGGRIFDLKPYKGKKKIAVLPWEDIAPIARAPGLVLPPTYGGIRGKIVFAGQEIGFGESLPNLMRMARSIDPAKDILHQWPRKKNYDSLGGRADLVGSLGLLLKLARLKKPGKALGFLALHTDAAGRYWYKPGKTFLGALETSLASLESLVDELSGEENAVLLDGANKAYRKLTAMIEE
jgi:RNA helicase HrpA